MWNYIHTYIWRATEEDTWYWPLASTYIYTDTWTHVGRGILSHCFRLALWQRVGREWRVLRQGRILRPIVKKVFTSLWPGRRDWGPNVSFKEISQWINFRLVGLALHQQHRLGTNSSTPDPLRIYLNSKPQQYSNDSGSWWTVDF